jgi:hypothetical protein
MKEFSKMSLNEKLESIRRFFMLEILYFVPQASKKEESNKATKKYSIYINSPDDSVAIDTILLPQYDLYKNTLDKSLDSVESLLDIEQELLKEKRIVERIITEYNLVVINNFPRLVGYIVKRDGSFDPFMYDNNIISIEYKEYLKRHFIYRRDWLLKLADLLNEALDKHKLAKNLNLEYKQVFEKTPAKNVTEIWYPLEKAYFSNFYNPNELKILRKRFYQFFGINDNNYSKTIGEIKELVQDSRTKFLSELSDIIETDFSGNMKGSIRKANSIKKKDQSSN